MLIVLDTNIIVSDFQLKKTAARVLLQELPRTQHSLHIPQLVLDEVVNKYRNFLEQYYHDLKKLRQNIERRINAQLEPATAPIEVDQMIEQYRANLKRKLEAVKTSFVPYPRVSHEKIARRDMDRRKPFSENGAGYRDTLIWESILGILGEPNNVVAFVTADRDFANKQGELYPELKEDLTALGIAYERIRIFSSLDKFVEQELKPILERLEDIRAKLNAEDYAGLDLARVIETKLEYVEFPSTGWGTDPTQTSAAEVGLPNYVENPTLVHADIEEFEVLDVRETSSGEYLIEVETRAEARLDFYIFKADWWTEADNDDDINIADADWNEHYILGEATRHIEMDISLTFDPASSNVTSIELRTIKSAGE